MPIEKILRLKNEFAEGKIEGRGVAASILYELAREEEETSSIYAIALSALMDIFKGQVDYPETFEAEFREIIGDESNHCTRFKAMANEILGVNEPND